MLGRDVHVAWVAGQRGLQEQGADMGVAADWLRTESPPSDRKGALLCARMWLCAQSRQPDHEPAAQWQLQAAIKLPHPCTCVPFSCRATWALLVKTRAAGKASDGCNAGLGSQQSVAPHMASSARSGQCRLMVWHSGPLTSAV